MRVAAPIARRNRRRNGSACSLARLGGTPRDVCVSAELLMFKFTSAAAASTSVRVLS
jgi:hypothetical protein